MERNRKPRGQPCALNLPPHRFPTGLWSEGRRWRRCSSSGWRRQRRPGPCIGCVGQQRKA
eukprot:239932-Chlamydomonas_euryale.AAC.1